MESEAGHGTRPVHGRDPAWEEPAGDDSGPGSIAESTEIELDCDYRLRFEYVINAITAVSGTIRDGQIVKLIEKIKFAPPRGEE